MKCPRPKAVGSQRCILCGTKCDKEFCSDECSNGYCPPRCKGGKKSYIEEETRYVNNWFKIKQ